MSTPIKAVLFDFDGTLARYQGDFAGLTASVAGQLGIPLASNLLKDFTACVRQPGPSHLDSVLRCLLANRGLSPGSNLDEVVAKTLRYYCADMRLLPGAEASLAWLRGIPSAPSVPGKIALISNGPADMQRAAVETLGLTRYFDVITISGDPDVGVRKPEPRIFLLTCERLSVSPEQCLMVGDNPEADIGGAAALGMRTHQVGSEGVQFAALRALMTP